MVFLQHPPDWESLPGKDGSFWGCQATANRARVGQEAIETLSWLPRTTKTANSLARNSPLRTSPFVIGLGTLVLPLRLASGACSTGPSRARRPLGAGFPRTSPCAWLSGGAGSGMWRALGPEASVTLVSRACQEGMGRPRAILDKAAAQGRNVDDACRSSFRRGTA